MLQFTAWCFRLVQKLQSQLVVGSRNRYNGWSSASDKFSRVHQLITSTQFPSVGTVIGLCLAQQSYLPCMIFWEVLIFQHSLFFPKSNHKDITTRNNKYLFIYLLYILTKPKPWCIPSDWWGWFAELMWFILWNINPCYAEFSPLKHISGLMLLSHSSECRSVAGLHVLAWAQGQFWVGREMQWHEEEADSQGTSLTEQAVVNWKKQWSDKEMKFKNLPIWGDKSYR